MVLLSILECEKESEGLRTASLEAGGNRFSENAVCARVRYNCNRPEKENCRMIGKFLSFVFLIVLLAAAGCAAFVAGAGTGVGVYTYMKGDLKRSYQATMDETTRACTDVFKSLKIEIEEKKFDGITTTIKALHSGRTPVRAKIVMIAPKITEVSVRSGIIGIWDKKVSELIHASIAQRLQ